MKSKVISNFKTKENFKCYIRENEFSSEIKDSIFFNKFKCGYIIIPTTNANFINIYNIYVHGGITYYEYNVINNKQVYVLGFDCAHYNDRIKYIKQPRTLGYCKNELIYMSKQIKKMIKYGKRKLIKNKIKDINNAKTNHRNNRH